MYGVVLLLAATAGGESASFGHRGHGCHGGCYGGGYGGCYGGGYGGCYGGCYGGGYGGCYGGCYGGGYGGCYGGVSYGGGYGSCYGGGYGGGCYGSVSYGGGCYGGGCYGSVSYGGCYGGGYGGGCCGGVIQGGGVPHGTPGIPSQSGKPDQDGKQPQKKKGKGGAVEDTDFTSATIEVSLPAGAELTIDGNATTSTSSLRRFRSPTLEAGKTYYYTFAATYRLEGKPVTVSKKVTVQAGQLTSVDLNQTASAVASK